MLDSVRQLTYVVLPCHDVPAAKRFYRDVMKLPVRIETPDWTEFRTGSTLLALRPRRRPYDGVRGDVAAADVQLAFQVMPGAVDSCHRELVERGVAILEPPSDQPFGHRTLFFRDPEGNVIEIYAELRGSRADMNPNEATELERSAADRTALLGMWAAFVNSRALQVVAELGIADELAAGPQDVSSLARKVRAHEGHLSRLLRTLSGAGAFAKDPQGVFRLTPRGEWLRSGVPRSVRDIVRMCDEALWNAFSALEYCVRTGKPAFERTAGTTFPEYLAAHPEASDRWDRGITALSADETQRVARACDLSHARRVIDIGGGQGGFLAEILSANEHLSGVLYDLPHVVSNPRALRESGMLGRCEVRGGDFLESPLPGGCDVHLIKRVLPGFDDECVVRVLSRCRAASPKDGRVLGIEALVLGGNHPHRARFSDVLMMVEGAGRERTEAEYRELYEKAGLEVRRVIPSGTSLSILEAVPCV